ncbi:hypothetical protein HQ496_12485, partial [bacterium]|nr:hypothetical protein [bacterium]
MTQLLLAQKYLLDPILRVFLSFIVLALLLGGTLTAVAQVHTADDVLVSRDESIFVTGSGAGNTFRDHKLGSRYTMRLDPSGLVQWVFDGGNSFPGRTLAHDSQGALYVISESQQAGELDRLVKLLPDGTVAWTINLVDGYDASLDITADDELCVSASFRGEYAGITKTYLRLYRIGSDGSVRWMRSVEHGSSNWDKATTIATSAGCYLGGEMEDLLSFPGASGALVLSGEHSRSAYLSFFNLNGQTEWARNLSNALVLPRQIVMDAEENIFMTGVFKNPEISFYASENIVLQSAGSFDAFVTKMNAAGEIQWANAIGGAFYDDANSLAIDSQGQLTVFGSWGLSSANGNTVSQLFFSQYDTAGNQTSFTLDGLVSESPRPDWKYTTGGGISFGPSGEKVVVGTVLGTATMGNDVGDQQVISGEYDVFVSKYDVNGQLVWSYGSQYIEPVDTLAHLYPRFTKLELGNRWEYKITDVSQTGAPGPFLIFDIPEENLVDGRIQKVLRAQEREADGTLRDESSCSIDVLGQNQYSAPSLISCSETGGQCRCMNRMVDSVIQDNKSQYVSVQEQVPIGPWDYWVDGKASYAFVGTGTGGSGGGS